MRDRKEITKALEDQCQCYGAANVEVGGLVAGYFYSSDSVTYDESKLTQHLTPSRSATAAPSHRRAASGSGQPASGVSHASWSPATPQTS